MLQVRYFYIMELVIAIFFKNNLVPHKRMTNFKNFFRKTVFKVYRPTNSENYLPIFY